jgi:hypothetical protein
MGLFTLVLYEQGVKLKESIAMAQDANKISDGFKLEKSPTLILRQYDLEEKESDLKDVVYDMEEEWDNPAYPHYVFVARGLSKDQDEIFYFVKEIVELVTAVPCIFGDQITETNIHEAIRIRIRNAAMVIADISEDNMNSCIEAGIALGANVKLNLIAKAPRKRPGPFMLRDQQVWHYEDDVELLGIAHNLVQQFKRRVINAELPQNEYWG